MTARSPLDLSGTPVAYDLAPDLDTFLDAHAGSGSLSTGLPASSSVLPPRDDAGRFTGEPDGS